MRCFRSMFKDKSPVYTYVSHPLCFEQSGFCWRWLNTLDLLSEFLWPRNTEPAMDCVSITGSLIQPLITRSKMHWKGWYDIIDNGHDSIEAMRAHCLLSNILIHPRKTRSKQRRRLSTAVIPPVSFPIAPTQKKMMAGSVHNHFMMQMTTVDL